MASGFITLQNGQDWSARWSGYDYVLETIMNSLGTEGDEGNLKQWLHYILPTENDVESGYCFFKRITPDPKDSECVLRIIDSRLMKENYKKIFWDTVEKLNNEFNINESPDYLINELFLTYQYSLDQTYVEPEDKDEDLIEIFQLGGFDIGK
jgi:hypothetical protein